MPVLSKRVRKAALQQARTEAAEEMRARRQRNHSNLIDGDDDDDNDDEDDNSDDDGGVGEWEEDSHEGDGESSGAEEMGVANIDLGELRMRGQMRSGAAPTLRYVLSL